MFEKLFGFTVSIIFFLTACTPAIPPTTTLPNETVTPTVISEQTSTPKPKRTPVATSTLIPLQLQKIEKFRDNCTEKDQDLPGDKLSEVAYLPSGFCFHGELDVFETGGHVYVAQVVMSSFPSAAEAFRIVDVTDAEQPILVGAWQWNVPTKSADVKAFRQGDRWFLALSRDPSLPKTTMDTLCSLVGGIAIIEVTDPTDPRLISLLNGENTGSRTDWCNSHTAEVSRDADGNGVYLYVSAVDIFDLRVLDIRDLEHVTEVGQYTHPDAGIYNERNVFLVHDTTIVGDRVYVAYWSAGLIILDRQALEAGKRVTPLNPLDSIAPWGLLIHHAYPTTDGKFVFVEDEFPWKQPESRLRLYDVRDLGSPKEVAAITLPDSWAGPHNLLVSGDLLFVGWYQDGVRVFKYDTSDPEHPSVEPYAFKAVRTQRTLNPYSQIFDGIWGVRLHECEVAGQPTTCVFASDITWGLLILAMEP
ncbi:MAG: hypothetical protein L0287_05120 [Anaerolineae bacterium]|nr:hypothetical protein [Anaerolineae bacterium]MCI0608104.1 hypothetical protein [Anaerolineae bacterium]